MTSQYREDVLVIGSGAREHAIVWKLLQSPRVRDVYVAPGNAGTSFIARNLSVQADDILGLVQAARENQVHLTVVGPEIPLALGVVDAFQRAGLRVFGPTQAAARIEASKAYAKELMQRAGIPCARSAAFQDLNAAREYLSQTGAPVVIKADGLAAGKGVTVCRALDEAAEALDAAMVKKVFGAAGNRVIIEEYLEGPEVSLLAFTDGETVRPMVPASDYKRVGDEDQGPNTGGMGSYSPPPSFGPKEVELATKTVLEPAVRALREDGSRFVGVLYAGLMLTAQGPKVLEFNCRFGDPETQVILPRLQTDLLDIVESCIDGRLADIPIEWDAGVCVGVVMASGGYPESYHTGFPITGLDQLDDGIRVFHAGTTAQPLASNSGLRRLWATDLPSASVDQLLSGTIQTAGGRVVTVVATGSDIEDARRKVYANVARIRFQGAHYRRDIAASLPRAAPPTLALPSAGAGSGGANEPQEPR